MAPMGSMEKDIWDQLLELDVDSLSAETRALLIGLASIAIDPSEDEE